MPAPQVLIELCSELNEAVRWLEATRRTDTSQGRFVARLQVFREDKVRVEIRQESGKHNLPHIHVTHSDKVDVSLSLPKLDILAGEIDRRLHRRMTEILLPKMNQLESIWNSLNVAQDHIAAQQTIKNLW